MRSDWTCSGKCLWLKFNRQTTWKPGAQAVRAQPTTLFTPGDTEHLGVGQNSSICALTIEFRGYQWTYGNSSSSRRKCSNALAQQRALDIFPCRLGAITTGHRSLWEFLWINYRERLTTHRSIILQAAWYSLLLKKCPDLTWVSDLTYESGPLVGSF